MAGEGPYDTACFHAQQAMEKSFKGFLAYHRQPIPRTHDLEELARLCQHIEPLPEIQLPELAEATNYAVQIRYDLETWPTQDEGREALTLAERIREQVLTHLPQQVHPSAS